MNRYLGTSFLFFLAMALSATARQKDFTAPAIQHARLYAAHDEHTDEHVTIAADPYDSPEKNAAFQFAYRENGFLPVRVVISNDNDYPLGLSHMQAELDFGRHARIQPASQEEILRRMAVPGRPGPRAIPLPIPLPRRKLGKKENAIAEELDQAKFEELAVEPQRTRAGFMFFDIQGINLPLSAAHLIVSRIYNGDGKELFYFDVPLRAAVSSFAPSEK